MHHWLARQGYQVSRKRVARIMAENNWTGECGRRKVRTTVVDAEAKPADDLVRQDFNPVEPNSTWCGDVTYIATGEGWLYLATVIDLFSRRVIGWSLAEHMRASLVANALSMASARRGGQVAGVIFHSDRASQYTSAEFGGLCEHLGVRQSMGRIGTAFDNAAAEAFFATLKKELVHRYWWPQRSDARSAVVSWIEGWYNTRRLHSSLRYRTPIEAETDWEASQVRTRRDGRLAA